MKRYELDGEAVDLADFIAANTECFTPVDAAAIEAMRPGEEMVFGGGAAATFVLRCVGQTCRDCDSEVPGIRGMCLEHRAQAGEELLEALREVLENHALRPDTAVKVRAALAKVNGK